MNIFSVKPGDVLVSDEVEGWVEVTVVHGQRYGVYLEESDPGIFDWTVYESVVGGNPIHVAGGNQPNKKSCIDRALDVIQKRENL